MNNLIIKFVNFQNQKEIRFPCVIKIGNHNNGIGKMKVENSQQLNDVISVFAMLKSFNCTIEPFIDAKCDLHIQKIANNYKAFV